MTFNETNRASDAHSDHIDKRTAPNRLDLLRLKQSKETLSVPSSAQDRGKGPAFYQKNERAIGEDGKPLEKLKLASVSTPEHPILLGGMRRGGDQASMNSGFTGQQHRLAGRYDKALADFTQAIALDGNNDAVLACRGETYRLLGRYDKALADFTQAIALDGNSAWVIGSRGQTYQAMKQYDKALTDLERALALDSSLDWVKTARDQVRRRLMERTQSTHESRFPERPQRNIPTTSSGEASSSRNAGESRSPERSLFTDRPTDSRRSGVEKRLGQQLGNYRLVHLLGQGGFADVYLGKHILLPTRAAVKVLQMRLVGSNLEQFRNEAKTLANLDHPHIVRVLDFGEEDGVPFLVMEYAPHGTLRQAYPEGTHVSPTQVGAYVNQIADALDYAHNRKLMHRDIKPENLLLGAERKLLLGDFGLVQAVQNTKTQTTKEMAGTMAYMAPEQIQGKPRPASDQYALGVVAYEWLSGKRPFQGSFIEIAAQHMMARPESLQKNIPGISHEIEGVVLRALEKDPKDRFPDVKVFARAFEQACRDSSLSSKTAAKLRLK